MGKIIDFNEKMNLRFKEAFDWALDDCKRKGIIPSPARMNWSDDEDYDRETALITLFYDPYTGKAYMRRDWLKEPLMQYNLITNFNQVRRDAPRSIQEMLIAGLDLYDSSNYDRP